MNGIAVLEYLRDFSFVTLVLRLMLAMLMGGLIGLEREFKHRPAGFRTYMLVCVGSALAMILGQYEVAFLPMISSGTTSDVSRFGAQCINGVGFLGAATILIGGHREVQGVTTAAGLWASACLGLAIGAGFYEGVLCAASVLFLCVLVFPRMEHQILVSGKNANVYVELRSLADTEQLIVTLRSHSIRVSSVDFYSREETENGHPGVILSIKLPQRENHGYIDAVLLQLESVYSVEEI